MCKWCLKEVKTHASLATLSDYYFGQLLHPFGRTSTTCKFVKPKVWLAEFWIFVQDCSSTGSLSRSARWNWVCFRLPHTFPLKGWATSRWLRSQPHNSAHREETIFQTQEFSFRSQPRRGNSKLPSIYRRVRTPFHFAYTPSSLAVLAAKSPFTVPRKLSRAPCTLNFKTLNTRQGRNKILC